MIHTYLSGHRYEDVFEHIIHNGIETLDELPKLTFNTWGEVYQWLNVRFDWDGHYSKIYDGDTEIMVTTPHIATYIFVETI